VQKFTLQLFLGKLPISYLVSGLPSDVARQTELVLSRIEQTFYTNLSKIPLLFSIEISISSLIQW